MSGPMGVLFDWSHFWKLFSLIMLGDLLLNIAIVRFIPYTEIDWIAYMEEVAGYLKENQLDYSQLRGQTGPLVYPGGFVWIFSGLYYLTDEGDNILRGQYIFIALHSAFLALLMVLYRRAGRGLGMPPWSMVLLCLSRRIHSIFVLRLFNDCVAMFFLYAAVLMFTRYRWVLGSLLFTMALSVKMNILLFMPPLLVVMVMSCGWIRTVGYLTLMVAFQVLVGVPFLLHDAWAYLSCSFNFSRQFIYFWSVNWQMVPEEIFLSKPFSNLLLALHLGTLVILGFKWCRPLGGVFPVLFGKQFSLLRKGESTLRLNPSFMVFLLFSGNFAGIAFSRSLHYQFYVWYYHTLPALLWCTALPTPVRLLLLVLIELVWNIYPARDWSSSLLLGCHMVLLVGVLFGKLPSPLAQAPPSGKKKKQ